MKVNISFCAIALVVAVGAKNILKEENAELIQDENKFKGWYECLMDQAPCPDHLKELKEGVPKYLETNCGDCGPEEKELYEKLTKMVQEMYPKEYKEAMDKYGPKTA